ncbi:7231_t:CDS:1, partial [Dentiscutata erythropus]
DENLNGRHEPGLYHQIGVGFERDKQLSSRTNGPGKFDLVCEINKLG